MPDEKDTTQEEWEAKLSMYQMRRDTIGSMPDGPEKDEAIRVLSQDYEGLTDIADNQLEFANELRNTPTPQGVQAGQVYVASDPWAHVGQALSRGAGSIGRYKAMKDRQGLSADQESATAALLRAGIGGGGVTQTAVPDLQQGDYMGGQSSQKNISGVGMSVQPGAGINPQMTMGQPQIPPSGNLPKQNTPSTSQGMSQTPPTPMPTDGALPRNPSQPRIGGAMPNPSPNPRPPTGGMPPMARSGTTGTGGNFRQRPPVVGADRQLNAPSAISPQMAQMHNPASVMNRPAPQAPNLQQAMAARLRSGKGTSRQDDLMRQLRMQL